MIVTNDYGREFTVRLVLRGDLYGRGMCLTHDEDEPMVEFYDRTYRNTDEWAEYGQFVSRYYLSTLREPGPPYGLDLDGGVPVWKVSARNMQEILDDLTNVQTGQ